MLMRHTNKCLIEDASDLKSCIQEHFITKCNKLWITLRSSRTKKC